MFLSKEEVQILTGRKQPAKQIEWCVENRCPFVLDAKKKPIILHSAVEELFGGQILNQASPNFDCINEKV